MTHAIVLVQADRAAMPSLGSILADLDGVREVYSVTGEWDFVVIVVVQHHDDLADVVTEHVTQVEGVARTQTMVAFEAFSRHDLDAMFSIGAEPERESGDG